MMCLTLLVVESHPFKWMLKDIHLSSQWRFGLEICVSLNLWLRSTIEDQIASWWTHVRDISRCCNNPAHLKLDIVHSGDALSPPAPTPSLWKRCQANFRASKMHLCKNNYSRKWAHDLETKYVINSLLKWIMQEIEFDFYSRLCWSTFASSYIFQRRWHPEMRCVAVALTSGSSHSPLPPQS